MFLPWFLSGIIWKKQPHQAQLHFAIMTFKKVCHYIFFIIFLWVTRGARNPNLQLIMHASHVCSQHSFGLPLRVNGMHRAQFDHACFKQQLTKIVRAEEYFSSLQ